MSKRVFLSGIVAAALALLPSSVFAKDFGQWLVQARADAIKRGISESVVNAALHDGLKPIPRIIQLDRKQPEKTKTFGQYVATIVSADRVEKGRTRYLNQKSMIDSIGQKYGVDGATIVALWGIETNYGQNTGGFHIIPALATLAYDGRREAFFREELMKALHIVDDGHISLDNMKGSWAGAMGQSQFMPSSFLRFAVDHNGDGKRDIWNTRADVFASAANYLSGSGWKKGERWGREVTIPAGFNRALIGMDAGRHSISWWQSKGVRMVDGKSALPANDTLGTASLIQPDGPKGRAFLVYDNYRVIMAWNKSVYFATSVGLLSDRIRGGNS